LDLERPLRGSLQAPNVLDSLTFEDFASSPLLEDELEIQVKAIGINAADMDADSAIGLECSGVVTKVGAGVPNMRVGDRVAGFTPNGSLSTVTRAQNPFLFKLPDHTAFESAASIPMAYSTASYALMNQAGIIEGESVLIHDAANAIGQAAISIAQVVGADIWATVRTAAEKDLLMREFGVTEERIMYAGNKDFAEVISEATGGRGVDVIFDSLTDSHLHSTTQATLADFGRHVKIGACNNQSSSYRKSNTTVFSVDIIELSRHRLKAFQRTLADVARMLKHGMLQPIHDVKTYGISKVTAALHDVHVAGLHAKAVIIPQADEVVLVSVLTTDSATLLTWIGTAT
jgi:NADPH:quinone reductase-like Zn-dependent oxidoreductase